MLLVGALVATAAPAQPQTPAPSSGAHRDSVLGGFGFSAGKEPITVNANTLEFDYKSGKLVYRGQVVASQGDMKLESDELTVLLDRAQEGKITEVVAEGDVRMSKGTRHATAGRAVFDQSKRQVVLSEHAVLHDGPNEVSGERVVVYLDDERSVVEGGSGRVKAVLFPPKSATARDEAGP
jgi:lipopolysaccharide export system protein LptA